jgi:hypothetical protein
VDVIVISVSPPTVGNGKEFNGKVRLPKFGLQGGVADTKCFGSLEKWIGKIGAFLHFSCTTVQVLDYQWSG